jgi:hypothetical protein
MHRARAARAKQSTSLHHYYRAGCGLRVLRFCVIIIFGPLN